jgi:hypothetical protein
MVERLLEDDPNEMNETLREARGEALFYKRLHSNTLRDLERVTKKVAELRRDKESNWHETERRYIAAMALQGLLAARSFSTHTQERFDDGASVAVSYADALQKRLDETAPPSYSKPYTENPEEGGCGA